MREDIIGIFIKDSISKSNNVDSKVIELRNLLKEAADFLEEYSTKNESWQNNQTEKVVSLLEKMRKA